MRETCPVILDSTEGEFGNGRRVMVPPGLASSAIGAAWNYTPAIVETSPAAARKRPQGDLSTAPSFRASVSDPHV
jgi:hypothetical protein